MNDKNAKRCGGIANFDKKPPFSKFFYFEVQNRASNFERFCLLKDLPAASVRSPSDPQPLAVYAL